MNGENAQGNEQAPNEGSTQEESLLAESVKLSYEFVKERIKEEDNRRADIERKAASCIPILSFLLGAAGVLGKWTLDRHLAFPDPRWDVLALVCVASAFVTIIYAWWQIVLALKVEKYQGLLINDGVLDFFWENDIATIYKSYAKGLVPDFIHNRSVVDKKARLVLRGQRGIFIAACLLTVILILVGAHAWFPSPAEPKNSIPIGMLFEE